MFQLAAWSLPFVAILLCIAVLPLMPATASWWAGNSSKLAVSAALAALVCGFYLARGHGFRAGPDWEGLGAMLSRSVLGDYLPFIVLLSSLFTISGGLRLTGDRPAHPATNTAMLFLGAVLASLIGTTGASMVLIRPLLQVNSERRHVKHTVVFFIFLVGNIGGALLPMGDPPLFLGYLQGVPFFWTLRLWLPWLTTVGLLLTVYWFLDRRERAREDPRALLQDETTLVPFRLRGKVNLLLLLGVVLAVALLVPGRRIPGTALQVPAHLREAVELALCAASIAFTPMRVRRTNHFSFAPMAEVACLFLGIFITMQVPIELLRLTGPALGTTRPIHFFWASGALSSFLDNAPTYLVFFEAARTLPAGPGVPVLHLLGGGQIQVRLLEALALGSVFMGANTYIGNGPNFLVKSIAEERGVRMPSFFGYMAYSGLILVPVFILVTVLFFR